MSHRRTRVLRIIARLNVGGPAMHAVLLQEHLPPERFESLLAVGDVEADEGDMTYFAREHGVTPTHIPGLRRSLNARDDLSAYAILSKLIAKVRPDIVHTHTAKAGFLGRLAALRRGVPHLVHTYHGTVFEGYFSPLMTRAILASERALGRRTERLLVVSDRVREDLLRHRIGTPDRVQIVRLGLDLQPFLARRPPGALRAKLGLDPTVPLVGIVGRMVPVKDHEFFVDAATALARIHPTVHFAVVGSGETEAATRARAARLGLGTRIHFLGWQRDLPAVYADLDVVALTSRNEGTPVALIEALVAGKTVVALDAGGVCDVLEQGSIGTLVRQRDAKGFAEALAQALAVPVEPARTAAISARLYERYAAARLVEDIATLYDDLTHRDER